MTLMDITTEADYRTSFINC